MTAEWRRRPRPGIHDESIALSFPTVATGVFGALSLIARGAASSRVLAAGRTRWAGPSAVIVRASGPSTTHQGLLGIREAAGRALIQSDGCRDVYRIDDRFGAGSRLAAGCAMAQHNAFRRQHLPVPQASVLPYVIAQLHARNLHVTSRSETGKFFLALS